MILSNVWVSDETPIRLIGVQTNTEGVELVVETVEKFGNRTLSGLVSDFKMADTELYPRSFRELWRHFIVWTVWSKIANYT